MRVASSMRRRERPPRSKVGIVIALAGGAVTVLAAVVALASLLGSGSPTSHSSPPGSTTKAGVTAGNVEQAILRQRIPPRPTAASCRVPTPGERAAATIGGADSVFFSCQITLEGQSARYYVQVLSNGSFIAERERRGQEQIFGCCVARPAR
jgi:hypothetical protein